MNQAKQHPRGKCMSEICHKCGCELDEMSPVCPGCFSSGAERSGVPQGCLPSAGCSSDARASDEQAADSLVRSSEAERPAEPKCRWLITLEEKHECGRPATHVRRPSGLTYCTEHAITLAPFCALEILPSPALTAQRQRVLPTNDKLCDHETKRP